ncbi:MAG: PTS sugar transporter subunit IIB [Coprobacillus sp.]
MAKVTIQTVCGFGCGSSLMLKMKVESIIKEHGFDAEAFCSDVGTCISNPCDAIFISKELADRIVDRSTVPVVVIENFMNKDEVVQKTLEFFNSFDK